MDRRWQIDVVRVGIEKEIFVLIVAQRSNLRQQRRAIQKARKPVAEHPRGAARRQKDRRRGER